MKTILVPVDLSTATAQVCDAACALARLMNARLLFLHVVQTPPFLMNDYYSFDPGAIAEVITAGEKAAAQQLRALARRYARRKVRIVTRRITGQPVAKILEQAKATKSAYIVVGSHGHGAVFDLLVGSTTHGILRKAQCPVLVVPMTPK